MNMKRIVATLLALVMCFALVACGKDKASKGGGYKDAIETLMDVRFGLESSRIEDMAPKAFWDALAKTGITVKDVEEEFDDFYLGFSLEEEYGSDFETSYKILEKEEVDKDDLEDFKEHLEDEFGISGSAVKSGYSLVVELAVRGSEDERITEAEIYAVQIGNAWYLLDEDEDFYVESLVHVLFKYR